MSRMEHMAHTHPRMHTPAYAHTYDARVFRPVRQGHPLEPRMKALLSWNKPKTRPVPPVPHNPKLLHRIEREI